MRIEAQKGLAAKRKPIVMLDGVDVTNFSYLADDESGEVRMYAHKASDPLTILDSGVSDEARAALPRLSPSTEIVSRDPNRTDGVVGYVCRGKVEITFKDAE